MNFEQFNCDAIAKERGVGVTHVARECLQLDMLRRISASDLRKTICFKGGTALHLVYHMERYSEDLDFSLVAPAEADAIVDVLRRVFHDEEVTDVATKRKTIVFEVRQQFRPQNFRVKLEINMDDQTPAALKTLYSPFDPASFSLQIMRSDYLVAQKIRALLQRGKGRDLYDLWFILRTHMPIDYALAASLVAMAPSELPQSIEEAIGGFQVKQLAADLNPFVHTSMRKWVSAGLREEALQLFRAYNTRAST
jgi:predicted nucleotidyltransferase component of viral defense system